MKKVYLHDLKIGDVFARPVFLSSGKVLFPPDKEVTEEVKDVLARYGVIEVYVHGEDGDELQRELEKDRKDAHEIVPVMESYKKQTKEMVDRLLSEKSVNKKDVIEVVNGIVDTIAFNKNVSLLLSQVVEKEKTYLVDHSINTVMFAVAVAERMGYSRTDVERIGTAAMLHDIGMAEILKYIDDKQELSEGEWEAIRKHPLEGKRIAKDVLGIDDELILNGIVKHHERKDGTGYPGGLKDKEIEQSSYIIAVCDVFSALTMERSYREISSDSSAMAILKDIISGPSNRKKYFPYEAIRLIMADTDRYYDVDVVRSLLYTVAVYPLGSMVKLNTGEIGVVAATTSNPFRPKIDILVDEKGVKLQNPVRVDLNEEGNFKLYIVKGIEEGELDFYLP